MAVAFFAGVAYAAVAIPAQTQLQEDLPEDVRGRVFGVLNMLVSVASFLPILIVGPISDVLEALGLPGTTVVIIVVALFIAASGIASIRLRGPLRAVERDSRATVGTDRDPFVTALGVESRPGARQLDGEPVSASGEAIAPIPETATPATAGSVVAEVVNPIMPSAPTIEPEDAAGEPVDGPDRRPSA